MTTPQEESGEESERRKSTIGRTSVGSRPRGSGEPGGLDSCAPSVVTAAVIVDELIRAGVRDVVICPGSRSAPLAFAFAEAGRRGEIRVHMRTDERTAAFLALGLAKANTPRPVGVCAAGGADAAGVGGVGGAAAGASGTGGNADSGTAAGGIGAGGSDTTAGVSNSGVSNSGAASGRSNGVPGTGIVGAHRVVPIVMTSGSAVAHCAPALVEAQLAHHPIMVLSANRPWSYWGTGANQTIDQRALFPSQVVRAEGIDTSIGNRGPWETLHREVRAAVDRALCAATGTAAHLRGGFGADAQARLLGGPVHIDVPFVEPLVVRDEDQLARIHDAVSALGRPGGGSWTTFQPQASCTGTRVLHIAGDAAPRYEELAGIPTVAEPTAPAPEIPVHPLAVPFLKPDHVIVSGRPTLHRPVSALLADPNIPITVLSTSADGYPDVAHTVQAVAGRVTVGDQDAAWIAECEAADQQAIAAVRDAISGGMLSTAGTVSAADTPDSAVEGGTGGTGGSSGIGTANSPDTTCENHAGGTPESPNLTGLTVAAAIADSLAVGDALVIGASNPIRDMSLVGAPFEGVDIFSSRGAAGIDGFLSTAVGIALARQQSDPTSLRAPRVVALAGDLTFLHDLTGLNIAPDEPAPSNLLIVVANDRGGSIFEALEPGKPELRSHFERLVATAQDADIAKLCEGFGAAYQRAETAIELAHLLEAHAEGAAPAGITVLEAVCDRHSRRTLHQEMAARVAHWQAPAGGSGDTVG